MRVVHVNTEKTFRGGESQVFNLMLGLRARGIEVEAAALPEGVFAARCREAGLAVTGLAMRSDADLPAAWRLARRLKEAPCDLLHAQTARGHSLAILARLMGARCRVVVSRRIDFPVRRDPLNRWKYRTRLVDRYIAVAGIIRDILLHAGVEPGRVSVIHSSIDLLRFSGEDSARSEARAELGISPGAPVVGHVAALAWHKGQKDLIAAMPAMLRERPDLKLVMVGGGEEGRALRALASALKVESAVIFTGPRSDVPRLLSCFDAFCMPSYLEGLCNSVLEAFAMRVPVVATRAGGLPEIVVDGSTGLLAPVRDPEALARALLTLLADRALASRLAGAAHRLVTSQFGADRMVERTAALYREVAGASAPAPAAADGRPA
ncbi:MAG TPA: glycosyltransferase family 4 protein [Candidatus Polarisedimenticolia bacterium]|nr:glycosyltransferase family 4 protein [Candidatus Polarisedimenticolia bacterium]